MCLSPSAILGNKQATQCECLLAADWLRSQSALIKVKAGSRVQKTRVLLPFLPHPALFWHLGSLGTYKNQEAPGGPRRSKISLSSKKVGEGRDGKSWQATSSLFSPLRAQVTCGVSCLQPRIRYMVLCAEFHGTFVSWGGGARWTTEFPLALHPSLRESSQGFR